MAKRIPKHINQTKKYALVDIITGKQIERCRLKANAMTRIHELRKKGIKTKIVDLSLLRNR